MRKNYIKDPFVLGKEKKRKLYVYFNFKKFTYLISLKSLFII